LDFAAFVSADAIWPLTSFNRAIRIPGGGDAGKTLHKLVYGVAVLAILHFLLDARGEE
jgi:DMSO/TMAO reductase YedYZ heme-binding membrane subunit